MHHHRTSSLFAFAIALVAALPGLGSTIGVSNIGQPNATNVGVGKLSGFNFQEAGSFVTGSLSSVLDSVRIEIAVRSSTVPGGSPTGFNLALYTGITTSGPTGFVTSLLGASSPAVGFVDYTAQPDVLLDPFTTYWLVASAPSTAAGTGFGVRSTLSSGEDVGGLADWTMGDKRWLTNNGGVSWNEATSNSLMEFSVTVTPVEPTSVPDSGATLIMLGLTFTFLPALRRRLRAGR